VKEKDKTRTLRGEGAAARHGGLAYKGGDAAVR
jgi:hypothetical protein